MSSPLEGITVLFLHGWHSGPVGNKSIFLQERGCKLVAPALCPDSFETALQAAQEAFDSHTIDVVVGSSRGGAVAMNINAGKVPLVLVCPAWKHWGQARTVKAGTTILHSPHDEVIPIGDSEELVQASGLQPSALKRVGEEHRMGSPEALEALWQACERAAGIALPKIPLRDRLVTDDTNFPSLEPGTRHVVSRKQKPEEYPDRGLVPNEPGPDYSPTYYVSPKVAASPEWAESTHFKEAARRRAEAAGLSADNLSDADVARLFPSYEKPVIVDGVPRNPRGITGITGQGLLGKHGENTAADPIVFRRQVDPETGETKLQMIAIQRRDNGMWAIPGGMTDFGESVSETLGRELREEALGESVTPEQAQAFDKNFKTLFEEKGTLVYAGAVDDFRNTDTSWMASKVKYVELSETDAQNLGWDMTLAAGDDAKEATWMDVTAANLKAMNANHGDFVAKAVQMWQQAQGQAVSMSGLIGVPEKS